MNNQELTYLGRSKFFEGKTSNQIHLEINNLINSQKLFKEQNRTIKRLTKEIEKLNKKIEKKQKSKFLQGLKQAPIQIEKKTNLRRTANVHQLKRILTLLQSSEKPLNLQYIYKTCGMLRSQAESAKLFLINHNLIKRKKDGYII